MEAQSAAECDKIEAGAKAEVSRIGARTVEKNAEKDPKLSKLITKELVDCCIAQTWDGKLSAFMTSSGSDVMPDFSAIIGETAGAA